MSKEKEQKVEQKVGEVTVDAPVQDTAGSKESEVVSETAAQADPKTAVDPTKPTSERPSKQPEVPQPKVAEETLQKTEGKSAADIPKSEEKVEASKDPSRETSTKPSEKPSEKSSEKSSKKTLKRTSKRKGKKKKKGEVRLKGISPADVEFSLRHMSLMLKSGLSITEALSVTIEQVADDRLGDIYSQILEEVQHGKNIADAMSKYPKVFTEIITSIIRVSEQTGTLESNLMFLAEYLKKSYELQRKVRGALVYPLIVLGLTGAEMIGMIFFIMPKLDVMFSAFEDVPAFSRAVVDIAGFIRENVIFLLVGGTVFSVLLLRFTKTKTGKRFMDKVSMKFPIVKNLVIKNILASFSRTLGMLLETGIPISESLKITSETMGNSYYSETIMKIYKEVKGGQNLADSMMDYQDYFPISFIRIIQAGEKTGTLEENLEYMYESYSGEVEEMADNMVTLIEPLMLIFAGMMIALLAISIVAPIYQFTSSVN